MIIVKYAAIFLFCIIVTSVCSCSSVLKKAEKLASGIPFNYPGLRIETRSIDLKQIKSFSPRIVCFGDSVTFGWNMQYKSSYPQQLEDMLAKEFPQIKVINSGIGGDTIIDANKRIDRDVISFGPDVVIINFGLNDGMISGIKSQVDIEDFCNYYNELIEKLDTGDLKIMILGINPVTDIFPEKEDENFRKTQRETFEAYNKKIIEIAEENDIEFINLWDKFNQKDNLREYIQNDGIHPDIEGSALIAKSVYEKINDIGWTEAWSISD